MTDLQIARTILEQLGGNRFLAMTGAKHLDAEGKALWFSLPGRSGFVKDRINRVEIRLMPTDTYTVRFWRLAKLKGVPTAKKVAEIEGVYADSLQEIFRKYTGLETSL